MTTYQPLIVSNDLLNAPDALRLEMEKRGYLFFRNLLPPEAVRNVYLYGLGILAKYDLLDPSRPTEEGIFRGGDPPERRLLETFHLEINRLESFESLPESRELVKVMERVLGGEAFVHTRKICRVKYPNDPYDIVVPHQDHFYIRGDLETYSCWIPLMPMDERTGGLAVAPESHRLGFVEHMRPSDSRFTGASETLRDREWHRSDFESGDVLIFHSLTLHQGLLNTSEKIRLSMDCRFQRPGTPMEASHDRRHFE